MTTYFSDAQQFQAPWPHAFKPVPPKLSERHREYWRIREHSGPWALFCCFASPPDKDSIVPALRIKSDMKMLVQQLVKLEPWLQSRWMHSPLFSKSHDSRFRIRRSCSCCVGGDGFPTTAQIGARWGHPNGASKIWILLKLFSFAGLRRVGRWMRMITTYLHYFTSSDPRHGIRFIWQIFRGSIWCIFWHVMCLAYLLSCFLAHRPRPATRGNAGSASNEGFRSAFYLGLRPVAAFNGGKLQQSSSVAMQSVRSVRKRAKPLLSIGAVAFTFRRCRSQRFHRDLIMILGCGCGTIALWYHDKWNP